MARTSILVGRLTGASVTGACQAVVFIVVYGLFGVRIAGGVPGACSSLVLYAMVLALVIGGFAAMLALRTGSAEAVQNVFPLTFISLFISSAFFPTEAMQGVYQTIAELQPDHLDDRRHALPGGRRLRLERGGDVDRRRRRCWRRWPSSARTGPSHARLAASS